MFYASIVSGVIFAISAFTYITATENVSAQNTVEQKKSALQTDFPRADLNGDGVVDYVDLGIVSVAVSYGNCAGCPEDVNNDGVVNEGDLMLVRNAWSSLDGPLPPPPLPPNIVPLTPVEQLGKFMVFDVTLSNPPGQSCAACHTPETGFVGPSSRINAIGCDTPGVIPDRVGDRKPYTYNYASFSPNGVRLGDKVGAYTGGQFWDGRAATPAEQSQGPPVNPNEMNNTAAPSAANPSFPYSQLLVEKLMSRPYTPLLKQVYGENVFTANTPDKIYVLFSQAIAAFEASGEINQFSSQYDSSKHAVPPLNNYTFTASQENGRALFFGKAKCSQCHSSENDSDITAATNGKDVFTMFCYANLGVPKNMANPFYKMTNPSNPGYNAQGADFIDYGLGGFLYPKQGLPIGNVGPGNNGRGDFLAVNGMFLSPTIRNADKRPYPAFVKNYMHNGVFKSLKEVVHFYNTRNLTTVPGEVIDFTLPDPYANLKGKPLWDKPELISAVTLTNPTGARPLADGENIPSNINPNINGYGEVGNLGLTEQDEIDLVNFLSTLTDGHSLPSR